MDPHPADPANGSVQGHPAAPSSTQGSRSGAQGTRHILFLGAGMVAGPAVDYLLRDERNHITLASVVPGEAERLARGRPRISCMLFDVAKERDLAQLIKGHTLVISLIPAPFHPIVARHGIAAGVHVLTASYISPELKALDSQARSAGVLVMNECGLDPGIDHLAAMATLDEVQEAGGQIESFESWCGGLPAPEAADNPLKYKFSWSPKGAILSGLNSALYRKDGRLVRVDGQQLWASVQPDTGLRVDHHVLEGLPNRDSMQYSEMYKISQVRTMFRGTLRYAGFSVIMWSFLQLGLLDQTAQEARLAKAGLTWPVLLAQLLRCRPDRAALVAAVRAKLTAGGRRLSGQEMGRVVEACEWLGLLGGQTPVVQKSSVLDSFADLMAQRMSYGPGERDMVVLQHVFGIRKRGGQRLVQKSTLKVFGQPGGYSAMALTVGVPVGIMAQLMLDGRIQARGVQAPLEKEAYVPMLQLLEGEGIRFVDVVTPASRARL